MGSIWCENFVGASGSVLFEGIKVSYKMYLVFQ
jgi:hypothetical protein